MANPPSSQPPNSGSASADDTFESELPTGDSPIRLPANIYAARQQPFQGRTPNGQTPNGQAIAPNSSQTPPGRSLGTLYNHNESFTVDYNPDPDSQADNEELTPYAPRTYLSNDQAAGQAALQNYPDAEDRDEGIASGVAPERYQRQPSINPVKVAQAPISVIAIAGAIITTIGFTISSFWLTLAGSIVTFVVSLKLLSPTLKEAFGDLTQQQRALFIAVPGLLFGIVGLISTSGITRPIARWGSGLRWDIVSALGDFLGAIGQILIAVIAVYVAWRQYIISRDLTLQQNLITQQQTIDSYFQGISELVLDDEGLLEDWPQERVIAEARTAAILSSVDAGGKAKVLRFLSRSKLLTPLARDQRLGRPILDGMGGYAEDRLNGTRVIDLGVMLAASSLANTDLRWLDLSEANLIRSDLIDCDLVRTNFARAILCDANLTNSDVMGVRFFYGDLATATPRTRQDRPDYTTGEFTGAVVEGIDLTNVQRFSEVQRCYCCAWGGSKTRATVPGGCEGIPNRLGR